jgi:outer membrane protein assembly factor BamB
VERERPRAVYADAACGSRAAVRPREHGVLDSYEVQSGAEVYRARVPEIGSGVSASPVAADGKIYLCSEDGGIVVVAADRTFRHIATSDIGEPIMATPALSGGVLFVRTMNRVYAIGATAKR